MTNHLMNSIENVSDQFENEKNEWRKILNFFTDESLYLKNRLNKLIKMVNGSDRILLEKLEDFQNRVVQEDMLITFLRAELAAYEKLWEHRDTNNERIIEQQKKFKREIALSQDSLHKLFIDYHQTFGDLDRKLSINSSS